MFDVRDLKYRLLAVGQDGTQYAIQESATDLGWEQNPGELATRISFTIKDERVPPNWKRPSQFIKPGSLIIITASCGNRKGEVARGYVTGWKPTWTTSKRDFKVTAYDELFNLQKSQDNIYYSDGTRTKTIITDIASAWNIPIMNYDGPDVAHDKMAFSSKSISDIIYDTLKDAVKKGGHAALLDAQAGKLSVVRWGSNKDVWVFERFNSEEYSYSISTADMVTRVKVIGEQNDDERAPVEAVLDGHTEFGIRQRILKRGTDDSVEDARADAQEILDEDGEPKERITITSPDVPWVRKGHKVHTILMYAVGDFYVRGVRHDASDMTMKLDLTKRQSED